MNLAKKTTLSGICRRSIRPYRCEQLVNPNFHSSVKNGELNKNNMHFAFLFIFVNSLILKLFKFNIKLLSSLRFTELLLDLPSHYEKVLKYRHLSLSMQIMYKFTSTYNFCTKRCVFDIWWAMSIVYAIPSSNSSSFTLNNDFTTATTEPDFRYRTLTDLTLLVFGCTVVAVTTPVTYDPLSKPVSRLLLLL